MSRPAFVRAAGEQGTGQVGKGRGGARKRSWLVSSEADDTNPWSWADQEEIESSLDSWAARDAGARVWGGKVRVASVLQVPEGGIRACSAWQETELTGWSSHEAAMSACFG